MPAWESIQLTLHWIEENLHEKMEIEKLAKMANLSPFYYQRLFNRLVGKSVMEYVKLRRLANAAEHLVNNQTRIIDTALAYGFENHETFSRAFKEAYGMTPESYRENPRPLSHFLVPQLSLNYYVVDENVPLAADGIILEVRRSELLSPRHFLGIQIENPVIQAPVVDYLGELWGHLHTIKQEIKHLKPNGNELGVMYIGETPGTFYYFTGAEIENDSEQEGFVLWTLPKGHYAVCSFEAEDFNHLTADALNKAGDYMFKIWLKNHNLTPEPFMAEMYYDTSPDSTYMEIWIKTGQ